MGTQLRGSQPWPQAWHPHLVRVRRGAHGLERRLVQPFSPVLDNLGLGSVGSLDPVLLQTGLARRGLCNCSGGQGALPPPALEGVLQEQEAQLAQLAAASAQQRAELAQLAQLEQQQVSFARQAAETAQAAAEQQAKAVKDERQAKAAKAEEQLRARAVQAEELLRARASEAEEQLRSMKAALLSQQVFQQLQAREVPQTLGQRAPEPVPRLQPVQFPGDAWAREVQAGLQWAGPAPMAPPAWLQPPQSPVQAALPAAYPAWAIRSSSLEVPASAPQRTEALQWVLQNDGAPVRPMSWAGAPSVSLAQASPMSTLLPLAPSATAARAYLPAEPGLTLEAQGPWGMAASAVAEPLMPFGSYEGEAPVMMHPLLLR